MNNWGQININLVNKLGQRQRGLSHGGVPQIVSPLCLCPNLLEINVDLTPIVLAKKNTCSEVFDLIEDVGRRDWTRTNDPHHVKVVL